MKKEDELGMISEDSCIWSSAAEDIQIGIVGAGPGLTTLIEIMRNELYWQYLPGMRLVAVAEFAAADRAREGLEALAVPFYPTAESMLAAHPEIDLVIELSGKVQAVTRLRSLLPDRVSLIDHRSAVFLCCLHDLAKASAHCRLNLDRHRALLQAIIDEVKEDILLLDLEGRVVDMNKNVWDRTGKNKEDLLGLPCHQVMVLDGGRPFCESRDLKCPFARTLASGEKDEHLLTRVNADGQLLYFRVYSYPILNPQGRMSHIMVMRRDITARTYRERHQEQAEKLAVIGEMSMYLAHEIKNPLFAIAGFSNSLLKSPNLEEKDREKLRIILEETTRLEGMLNSVLSFSRPAKPQSGAVDLAQLVDETVELMSIGYSGSGYHFSMHLAPLLPRVNGVHEKLKQCLVNLIKNSMEAMPDGGPIAIRAFMDGDMAALAVEDRGKGMTTQEMEKAFSPFYTTKEKGCGLGLAMIKKIVEEFGGSVSIKSRAGEGATVVLRLRPLLAAAPGGEIPDAEGSAAQAS